MLSPRVAFISFLFVLFVCFANCSTFECVDSNCNTPKRDRSFVGKRFASSPEVREIFLDEAPLSYYFENVCNQNTPGAPAGIAVRDDTIGNLVSAQAYWRLPGIDTLTHGFNIFTGTVESHPVFLFCYNDTANVTSRVQDTYRGNVYALPEQVFADALPVCSFSMTSATYSSSQEYAESMQAASGMSAGANAGVSMFGVSVSASYSYSEESSVKTASEMQSRNGGSLSVTQTSCLTSRVQLADKFTSFHPSFAWDLYNVKSNDLNTMVHVIDKYGSHFYEYVEFGGKLLQVVSVSSEYASKTTSSEMSKQVEESFSAEASGWGFSAGGSYDSASSSQEEQAAKEEFEKSTSKSKIVSYGGAPGTFGSSGDSSWANWASTIDLLPVPINYKLRAIYDIIPASWTTKDSAGTQFVKKLWGDAMEDYYKIKATAILREKLGADNAYRITVTIGDAPGPSVGPYGFKLDTIESTYNRGFQFLSRRMPMNKTTQGRVGDGAGAPFAFQPYEFWSNDKMVMQFIQNYDEGALQSITLCTADVVTNVALTPRDDFTKWKVTSIVVEDLFRSTLYQADLTELHAATTDTTTVTLALLPPSDIIKVTFVLPVIAVLPPVDIMFLFIIEGTKGSVDIYQYQDIVVGQTSLQEISFEQTVDYLLGDLISCKIKVAVAGSLSEISTEEAWSFIITGSKFRVHHVEDGVRTVYKSSNTGNIIAGIGVVSNFKLSPAGITGSGSPQLLQKSRRPISITVDRQ